MTVWMKLAQAAVNDLAEIRRLLARLVERAERER